MTTYPLSEAATVHVAGDHDARVAGRGTLEECVGLVERLSPEDRQRVRISMDDLTLEYGAREVGELVEFLGSEDAGLSNRDIGKIPDPE
jgi:hypothetical protein